MKSIIKNTITGEIVGELIGKTGAWFSVVTPAGETIKVRGKQLIVEAVAIPVEKTVTETKTPKAAKPPKAPKEPTEKAVRKCGDAIFARFAQYVGTKTAKGTRTFDCNDTVATRLRGLELEQVYEAVAEEMVNAGETDSTVAAAAAALQAKYGHLNLGMQRMNLGNKLRALMSIAA